jgi:hypothetical protein
VAPGALVMMPESPGSVMPREHPVTCRTQFQDQPCLEEQRHIDNKPPYIILGGYSDDAQAKLHFKKN